MLQTERFMLNKKIVEIHLDLLWNFTRSLAYYRAIQQDLHHTESNKEFWKYTMNAHYLRAITDWCIIFGADNNESHWKKLSTDKKEEFESEIRSLMRASANVTKNELDEYHTEVKDFRDKYASHRNVDFTSNVPNLDKAYEIAKSYFEWLKESLRPAKNEPKPLAIFFSEQQIEILNVLRPLHER